MINVRYKINEHHLGEPRLILESARNDTKKYSNRTCSNEETADNP